MQKIDRRTTGTTLVGVIKVGKALARFVRYETMSDGAVLKRVMTARAGGRMVERLVINGVSQRPRLNRSFARKTVVQDARKIFVGKMGFTEVTL